MRKVQHTILSALLLVLATSLSAAAAAEDGPFPVWWSPILELDSLDAIDARLARELWEGDSEGLPLIKSDGDTLTEVRAVNCVELERLAEEGYEGRGSHGYWLRQYQQAVCGAIALLKQAAPARESFLRDFRLDEDAIHVLPAMVDISPSCDMFCRQRVANERRIPLSVFEPVFRVTVTSDEEIEIRTVGFETDLTILARGDFNADGLDDMLVLASGGATEGTGAWADIFLLTREATGAVLTVLEEGTDVCAHYQCDATYDYPEALRETNPDAADTREISEPRSPITGGAIGLVPQLPDISATEELRQSDVTWTEGPPYPVWWSPNLELDNLDSIDARLKRDTWPGGLNYPLEIESQGTTVETFAKSCAALVSLIERGYRTSSRYLPDDSTIVNCRALYVLKQAQPAKVSHLRDLVLDDNMLEILPALLGFWTSSCAACQARQFNETRQSWARFAAERAANQQVPSFSDGSVHWVKVLDERRLQARALAWMIEIEFLAGGDFDGDGLDDVLVRRDIRDDLRAYYDSALFVLSRDSPDGVLWALSTEEALGAERACEVAGAHSTATPSVGEQCSMRAPEVTGDSHAETHPVWWSDDFELSSLDEVDRRMRQGFSRPSSGAFQMDKWPGLKDGPVLARNCEELLDYVDADYTIETDHEFGHWQAMRCRTILALKGARPASESHLRDFVLDAESLGIFPTLFRNSSLRFGRCRQRLYNQARFSMKADIGEQPTEGRNVFDIVYLSPSCYPMCWDDAANELRVPLSRVREILLVQIYNATEMKFWAFDWVIRLTILARADFNRDGIDDMLVLLSGGPISGTGASARTFLLTRDTPNAVLHGLNFDELSYWNCQCDEPFYDLPIPRGMNPDWVD
jgi:hypothetical protein